MTLFNRIIRFGLGLALISGVAQASPDIQHWTTNNGAKVYFVEAPELPMVDIRIMFDAAGSRDTDKSGLAMMTNGLLNEGTDKLNTNEIAEQFDRLGAQFGAMAFRDMAIVSLRSLTQKDLLDPAVDTLTQIITHPSFPQASLDRERKRLLIALQGKKQSPGALASEAFFQAIYGDHPYAAEPTGTEESIKSLTRDDLVKFHQQYYVARNATVAIVGAVSRQQAKTIIQSIMGELPAGQAPTALAEVKTLRTPQHISQDFPSSQTHLLIGQPGMKRNDPDYFPLYLGNHILGGSGLVSLLSSEVREKRGLSYSTYSYFSPMRDKGPFIMGLQTRNDQAQQAREVVMQTVQDFIDKGPTEEQLKAAKQNLTGGFAMRLDSNRKVTEYVAMTGFYDLPMDYISTLLSNFEAVTAEQIKDAFARRITPETMVTVMVGGKSE